MKKVVFSFLFFLLVLFARSSAHGATGCGYPATLDTFTNVSTGQILTAADYNKIQCAVEQLEASLRLPNFTVATKPASPQLGRIIYITDAIDATTCTTGGGSSRNVCVWNGTNWVTAGTGGGGGGVDAGSNVAWTGTHSWRDANWSLLDNADPTKIARFELSGLTSGTTRVYTLPDVSTTLLGTANLNATVVPFTPTATIAATNVAAAITETYDESQRLSPNLTVLASHTASKIIDNSESYCSDTGSTDAYVCTNPAVTETGVYVTGAIYSFRANTVNTGAASVNFYSGALPAGVRAIKKFISGSKVDLSDNDIPANSTALLTYDGTDMLCLSCVVATGGGTFTGSLATNNCIAKEGTGTTNATCSSIVDDGAGTVSFYDVSGNRHENIYSAVTGVRQHTWPDLGGTVVQSTGTLTSGRLAQWDATGLAIASAISTTAARTRQFGFMLGAEDGSTLITTNDQPDIFWNRLGQGITITEIGCKSDGGSPTIMLQRNVAGTLTNIQSADLICSTSGATTTTFSSTNNQIANNSLVNLLLQSASTAKRVTINVVYTLD
jgi:hypothetical protein